MEAQNLIKRLSQCYSVIPNWNYYRYDVLPKKMSKYRVTFERMIIRDYASLLDSGKNIKFIKISDYQLANEKIDK